MENFKFNENVGYFKNFIRKCHKNWKQLLEIKSAVKPFKILEITHISSNPGESKFLVQITNKTCVLTLTAAELIKSYNMTDFSEFHAKLIQYAAEGKILKFLDSKDNGNFLYRIISKKFDHNLNEFVFTVESHAQIYFSYTAKELANNKTILSNLPFQDIYDIGYTNGADSIIREKSILLFKSKNNN